MRNGKSVSKSKEVPERNGEFSVSALLEAAASGALVHAILIADRSGKIVWVNDAFTSLTGYSREEAVGQNTRLLKSGQHPEAFYRSLWNTVLAGETWIGEIVNRRKDGSLYHEEMSVAPIGDAHGEIAHFVSIKRDITARKGAEARDRILTDLIEKSPNLIGLADPNGCLSYVNQAVRDTLGFSPKELSGQHFSALLSKNNAPELLEEIGTRTFEPGGWRGECLVPRKNQTDLAVLLSSNCVRDPDGRLLGSIGVCQDITERKRIEEMLQDSENKYRALFEDSADAYWLMGEKGFVDCNAAALEIFGYESKAEMIALHPVDISPPNQPDGTPSRVAAEQRIAAAFLKGKERFEWYAQRKNGEVFPVEIYLTALTLSGRPLLLSTVRDITERKRAEQEILFKNALLEAQTETTIDGILAVDRENKIILHNQQMMKMWGLPAEMLVAGEDSRLLHFVVDKLQDPQAFIDRVRYLYSRHDEKSHDELHMKDGRIFDRYSAPLVDSARDYRGRIWYFRDITESKHAAESLRASEEQFRQLADNIREIFFVYGVDPPRMEYISPAYEEVFGKSRQSLREHPESWMESIYPEDGERVGAFYSRAMSGGAQGQMEYRIVRPDGGLRWIDAQSFPVRDAQGKFIRVVGVAEDVTARKQRDAALAEAHEQLNAALEASRRQAQDAARLTELVDILQSCQTVTEAYKVAEAVLQQLLPSRCGALCVTSPSRNVVEAVTTWGQPLSTAKTFAPEDCWALRRGKPNVVTDAASPLRCAHVTGSSAAQICVPLAAQGETIGILYLECAAAGGGKGSQPAPSGEAGEDREARENLAERAAAAGERVSLAVANLQLREVLRRQSIRDPLTGLYNRRYMEETLERELRRASRAGDLAAVLMLDIDHFKQFNDTFGHLEGDALLRAFGESLNQRSRAQDVACRYGGEEFVLILSGASAEAAMRRAELLREDLRGLNVQHAGQVLRQVTVSIGIAVFPAQGPGAAEMLQAADQALYRAKSEGRDRVVLC